MSAVQQQAQPWDDVPEVPAELAVELYRTMARIRAFEFRLGELFAAGELPGFVHLSIGQEAVAAGFCAAMRQPDMLTTTHRGHGHCLAKGADPVRMLAELYGRREGYCAGRSGSMHIADHQAGILGANAIVAAGIPIALGGAVAAATQESGAVSVAFFGDGAVAEGVFHESVNLAQLWRLPLVLVCENNGFAEMTPTSVHLANPAVSELVSGYGITAAQVDGHDVGQVHRAATWALEHARSGAGPVLLECHTSRWRGHFEGDQQHYRSREDLAGMTGRDPLTGWARTLQARAIPLDVDAIAEQERDLIEQAVAAARTLTPVQPADLTVDVRADSGADQRADQRADQGADVQSPAGAH